MKIQLIKQEKYPRMSTILVLLHNALETHGYEVLEVNHEKGLLVVNTKRTKTTMRSIHIGEEKI